MQTALGAEETALEEGEIAAHRINQLAASRSLDGALELGRYIVDVLFEGDLSRVGVRGAAAQSIRGLAARSDLDVSHTHLHYCVRVLVQVSDMPEHLWKPLSLSHHKALLTAPDSGARDTWAFKAVQNEWSARELTVRMRGEREKRRSRMRSSLGKRPTVRAFQSQVAGLTELLMAFEESGLPKLEGEDPSAQAYEFQEILDELGEAYARFRRIRTDARRESSR